MGASRLSLKRSLLLSTFFAAALFSTTAFAQNDDESTTTRTTARTTARTTPSTTPSQPPSSTPESTSTTARTTPTERPPGLGQSTSSTPTPSGTSSFERPPELTQTNYAGLPAPTYGPATIPPTNNAPFMNHSTLPDGTVFIVVGAILGAFGLTILAWRTVVGCLLHRSVERAALAQHVDVNKSAAAFPPPPAPFYKFTDRDSSPSLPGGGLGAPGAGARLNRKSHRGPTPSATPSQTNLFFSPTAAPAGGANSMGNRDSRFLPSGFYASASPAPGGQHGHGTSISLSNLRPSSRGLAGATGPTPPDSPSVRAQSRNFSSSSINLNRPPSGRAPSAFLDDLLDDPAHQGMFPTGQPGQMGPGPFGPATGYGQPGQGHARY